MSKTESGPMVSREYSSEKVNILLVDDRPDGLVTLEAVLGSPEYHLVSASSGREALGHLLNEDFAVCLLDVQMPEMDGYETAKLIKLRERSRDLPIIFVTAISKELDYALRGYALGAVDYITKPFDPVVLRSKVAVFVELYRKRAELARQAELLRRSQEKNRLLVEGARDIIQMLTPEGILTATNQAFGTILGWKPEEWIGKAWRELVHPEDRKDAEERWAYARARPVLFEVRLRCRSGSYLPVEVSAQPIWEGREVTGIIAMIRDISERQQVEAQKRRTYELERANKELEQFAHICSHDLQEPLRLVVSFSQLLKRNYHGRLGSDADEIIDHVVSGAKRMSNLVQELLTYSRLGDQAAALEPFDLQLAVRDALQNLRLAIQESGAKLNLETLPTIMGNRTQITRLLQNLLGNALKFRGTRVPEISLSAERRDGEWVFAVKDNGIGFEMQYADRIFVIFKRLHRNDEYPGNGMGLAICKRIVERHGGRIWVESQPGVGTTFFFTLPDAVCLPAEEETEATPMEAPATREQRPAILG